MGDVTGKTDEENKQLGDIASASEDPPVTRKEHNESLDLMRSMMEEFRLMRVEMATLRNQTPATPIDNSLVANPVLEGNSSQGTPPNPEVGSGEIQHPKEDAGRTYYPPPNHYASPTQIPMPHINNVGSPPMIDTSNFTQWQFLMKSHLNSACTQLWRIIVNGYHPLDPTNLTAKEEVDNQLNATASNIILKAMTPELMTHIRSYTTAKGAWDNLEKMFIGNASIMASKFEEIEAESNAFVGRESESPEELYRRVAALSIRMIDHGAKEVDDGWIKRKFMQAILPFKKHMTMSVRERPDFHTMTSNAVLNEFVSLGILEKNADDALARAQRIDQPNLALKAKATYIEEVSSEEEDCERSNEDIKYDFNEYMALKARAYWGKNKSSRPRDNTRFTSSATRPSGARVRSCYNCDQNNHFIADCPFEKKEDHGGRLVRKDRSKFSPNKNKNFGNKKGGYDASKPTKNSNNKKPQQKFVFLAREEFDSGEEESDEESSESVGVAAIAIASTPSSSTASLFDDPNENIIKATCLMAQGSLVTSSSSPSTPLPSIGDAFSLKVKREIVELDEFLENMEGSTKVHVEALMSQLGEVHELLDEKE